MLWRMPGESTGLEFSSNRYIDFQKAATLVWK
jgi:hypothetical protein